MYSTGLHGNAVLFKVANENSISSDFKRASWCCLVDVKATVSAAAVVAVSGCFHLLFWKEVIP